MILRYQRPVSPSAAWARIFARFAFGLFLASLLVHRFGPLQTPYFLALALLSAGLAVIGVLLAIVGFVRLWQVAAVGGVASVMALIYASIPIGFAVTGLTAYFVHPALYDLSTDTQTPPPWIRPPQASQIWLQRSGDVTAMDRAIQRAAYPGLTGRRYDGALDRVFQGVKSAADKTGIRIVDSRGTENAQADLEDMQLATPAQDGGSDSEPDSIPVPLSRPQNEAASPVSPLSANALTGSQSSDILLQGEWRTLIVGLRFDVLIRLREEAETTFVDLRVASRYGPHDLGIGAELADRFLRTLDAELLGIAGG